MPFSDRQPTTSRVTQALRIPARLLLAQVHRLPLLRRMRLGTLLFWRGVVVAERGHRELETSPEAVQRRWEECSLASEAFRKATIMSPTLSQTPLMPPPPPARPLGEREPAS